MPLVTASAVRYPLGSRMAIRTRVPAGAPARPGPPPPTDAVGEVRAVDDESVVLATRPGEGALPPGSVDAARVIPPRPTRRGAPERAIGIEDLHRVMTKGNPGLEVAWLGAPGRGWMLRAGLGFTGRANSALPLGDPGTTDEEAVERVVAWYRERDLVPRLQVPLPLHVDLADDPFAARLLAQGWTPITPALVLTGRAVPASPAPPGWRLEQRDSIDDAWLSASGSGITDHREAARAVLGAPREQVFLHARDADGELLGVGRASIDDGWTGVYSVHVAERARRLGVGRWLTTAATAAGAQRGASLVYLQVETDNLPAVRLYEDLGLRRHHHYAYLRLL